LVDYDNTGEEIEAAVDETEAAETIDDDLTPGSPGSILFPVLIMAGIFILAQMLAVAVSPEYVEEDVRAFGDNTDSVSNSVYYIFFLLIFSAFVLFLARKGADKLIQFIFLGAMGMTIWYALFPLLGFVLGTATAQMVALLPAGILFLLLYFYPEWYVVNASGTLTAVGVTAILGISLSPFPVLVLLIALAVYDAIAVYRTEHMIDLAESVTDLRLPVLLVVPKKLPFSYLKQKGLKEQLDSGEEREAMYMGLGDIVIPGVLAVSAAAFLTPERVGSGEFLGFAGNYAVAFFTALGGFAGFAALMYFVLKGKPQAGLPLLNSGAIAGYFISAWAIFGDLGLRLEW